ncbi:hypothetical protein SALBM311S_10095 [Streptomyces alboniger]
MFERFTKNARDVVRGAVEHAERLGHRPWRRSTCCWLSSTGRPAVARSR